MGVAAALGSSSRGAGARLLRRAATARVATSENSRAAACSGSNLFATYTSFTTDFTQPSSSLGAFHSLANYGVNLLPIVCQPLNTRRMSSLPPYEELAMPSLSPTMTQGSIVKWIKQEGETLAPGDVLCEIETDKATMEWEAQEEGILAKILVPAGVPDIQCGTTVAIIAEEGADISAFAEFDPSSTGKQLASAAPPEPASAASATAGQSSSFPAHIKLEMPSLSPTMEMGNLQEWKKKEGDAIAAGDSLAMIETDKASMDWESQEDGYLAKILKPDGSEGISVGTLVAVMVEDQDDIAAFANYTGEEQPTSAATTVPAAAPVSAALSGAPSTSASQVAHRAAVIAGDGTRIIASPYAKKLAAQASISLQGVAGTGPGGRIIAMDVEQLIATGGAKPAASMATSGISPSGAFEALQGLPEFEDIPVTNIKRITAARLLESKQTIPHYYLSVDCKIDSMMKLRAQLNKSLEKDGTKISVNDFIIKAAAAALVAVPECNASWMGDTIRQYKSVDMSVAVQTDIGLMVPIVKNADTKGLSAISSDVQRLAAKAKDGKLAPAEFMGGTFTISNLGMFGIKSFSAIVNPPQACILAVGGAQKRVVASNDGSFSEESFITVTLSCDHRVVDGAVGATWLKAFRGYLEEPLTLLL